MLRTWVGLDAASSSFSLFESGKEGWGWGWAGKDRGGEEGGRQEQGRGRGGGGAESARCQLLQHLKRVRLVVSRPTVWAMSPGSTRQ